MGGERRTVSRATLFVVASSISSLIVGWIILLTRSFDTNLGQDFTHNYVGGWALLHGYSPYWSTAPVEMYATRLHLQYCVLVEMPGVVLSMVPYLIFTPRVALVVYTAIQYLLVAVGAMFLADLVDRRWRVPVVAAIVGSPATFLLGFYGQIGAGVFVCACIGLWARRRRRWMVLGICVAAAIFVKPQLGLCAAVPLLWGAPRSSWKACLWAAVACSGATLAIVGPRGLWDYLRALRVFSTSPNITANGDGLGISSLYHDWLPGALTPWVTGSLRIAIVCAIGLLLLRYGRRPSNTAIAMLSLLAVLLLPYSHQYDAIVIFPALLPAVNSARIGGRLHLAMLIGLACILVSPLMAISAPPFSFRLVPAGIVLCLVAFQRMAALDSATADCT